METCEIKLTAVHFSFFETVFYYDVILKKMYVPQT